LSQYTKYIPFEGNVCLHNVRENPKSVGALSKHNYPDRKENIYSNPKKVSFREAYV
jgi:hypothetical protein